MTAGGEVSATPMNKSMPASAVDKLSSLLDLSFANVQYIAHSMIPDWIGNTIAAAFFLSGSYAFIYGAQWRSATSWGCSS